ncbi:hypothetical protein BC629DRAFT_789203 [Irpex lacteus]|nr:hypothetical protein BC629DRAFT_789203 [Irpex lacteus]
MVLAVTWTKTVGAYREARRVNLSAPLATMLFRDGTIYFIILLAINVLEVIGNNVSVLFTMDIAEPFFEIFPSMIVCHFILNLRQIEPTGSSWASANQSRCLRFVGSMGQSLQFGGEGEERDEETVCEIDAASAEVDVSPGTNIEAAEVMEASEEYGGREYITELEARQVS